MTRKLFAAAAIGLAALVVLVGTTLAGRSDSAQAASVIYEDTLEQATPLYSGYVAAEWGLTLADELVLTGVQLTDLAGGYVGVLMPYNLSEDLEWTPRFAPAGLLAGQNDQTETLFTTVGPARGSLPGRDFSVSPGTPEEDCWNFAGTLSLTC